MKNSLKKLLLVVLFVGVNLGAITLEESAKQISDAKHQDFKQVMICEREAMFIEKNPQECLKAVDMLLKSKKNLKSTPNYRLDYFGVSEEIMKLLTPDDYKKTNKEFIDEYIAESYVNAGVVYVALNQNEKKIEMYKKALEYIPNDKQLNFNLGIDYYLGQGVAVNKIKAYEHWRVAAREGDKSAQKNLDILCRESPWACK